MEYPSSKDVHRLEGRSQHWLCVAPLHSGSPVWIDVRELLQQNREAAVAWLVRFMREQCHTKHNDIVKFYDWHLTREKYPAAVVEAADDMNKQRGFQQSYVREAFVSMMEREAEGEPVGTKDFERKLCSRLELHLKLVQRWLSKDNESMRGMTSVGEVQHDTAKHHGDI
jgi:hypothetical protein